MSRSRSNTNVVGAARDITRPVWLLEIGFATPLRLSSRETLNYAGYTWTAAGLVVTLQGASVRLANADLAYTAAFLQPTAGTGIRIFQLYGAPPFAIGEAAEMFTGELGRVGVADYIDIQLRPITPKQIPRLFVRGPTFNHLPPDGARFVTPAGVTVLQRRG